MKRLQLGLSPGPHQVCDSTLLHINLAQHPPSHTQTYLVLHGIRGTRDTSMLEVEVRGNPDAPTARAVFGLYGLRDASEAEGLKFQMDITELAQSKTFTVILRLDRLNVHARHTVKIDRVALVAKETSTPTAKPQ